MAGQQYQNTHTGHKFVHPKKHSCTNHCLMTTERQLIYHTDKILKLLKIESRSKLAWCKPLAYSTVWLMKLPDYKTGYY